ncbi:MAG TPA: DUF3394 domain-containing protein, partial [Geminicoccaceae bacterium]|nr:DUF3394 domain-containing protein [Geminicoccaceae bacterium]
AANSLSGASLWNGGIAAMKLAATGYIIPFMFVYGPSLLMLGSWDSVLMATLSAVIGVTILAAGLHGYLLQPAAWWERLVMVGAAFVLIKPGLATDAIGIGLLAVVLISQTFRGRQPQPAEAGE